MVKQASPKRIKSCKTVVSSNIKRQCSNAERVQYFFKYLGSSQAQYTLMSAIWNNRKFYGHGRTEDMARQDVVNQIRKERLQSTQTAAINGLPNYQQSSSFPDYVENLVSNSFRERTNGHPEVADYKELAGIVLTDSLGHDRVIAIATGTKCINGGNLVPNGCVLNDSHAEIIARRCLMNFLYTQLKMHCHPSEAEQSIFYRTPWGKFALKPNYHFHLYITSPPCGDARFYIHNKASLDGNQGQLRLKVQGLGGNPPSGQAYVRQTFDAIRNGQSLSTMSCSDKIVRWNVLGVQGALLSSLIEPIYLSSIVLGSMFHREHLYRAVCGRLQSILWGVPQPFRLNFPDLFTVSGKRPQRFCERTPAIGINWTIGDQDIEIVSLPVGRLIDNRSSKLCKYAFFCKYIYLLKHLPGLDIPIIPIYSQAKLCCASDYYLAKLKLNNTLFYEGLGVWVHKPPELNDFHIANGDVEHQFV
ncbi:double-stranded RNA-specific editase Adar-like [Stomoxys calcitrans]|uniref:A to I editase domain-containing protein n=1 Tax=Stomoxys calcitrans TaxID=35570 RepID=A0A1I8PBK9_STOCA|nr:double-stranded RNA-specific editase Adar-like [Stomoxys calcitrans]